MEYLIFDVESSDLWNKKLSSVHKNQAWVVQFAGIILNEQLQIVKEGSFILQPPSDESTISPYAQKIHGISVEHARDVGLPQSSLGKFLEPVLDGRIKTIIGHNINFDSKFLFRFIKNDAHKKNLIKAQKSAICTMESSKPYLKLPPTEAMKKYKWLKYKNPKLIELHRFLFDEGFNGEHDALEDVNATFRCFVELVKRKVISV